MGLLYHGSFQILPRFVLAGFLLLLGTGGARWFLGWSVMLLPFSNPDQMTLRAPSAQD